MSAINANTRRKPSTPISHHVKSSEVSAAVKQKEAQLAQEPQLLDTSDSNVQKALVHDRDAFSKVDVPGAKAVQHNNAGATKVALAGYSRTGRHTHARSSQAKALTPQQFKQLAKTDMPKAAKYYRSLLKQGKIDDAKKLLVTIAKEEPEKAVTFLQVALDHFKASKESYLEMAFDFTSEIAGHLGAHTMSHICNILAGSMGMYNIAMFFKNVYDWLSQNYNAAIRGHEKAGFQDALKGLSKQLGTLVRGGKFDKAAATELLNTMYQEKKQATFKKLVSRFGENWRQKLQHGSHMEKTAIQLDLQTLKYYKQGLDKALSMMDALINKNLETLKESRSKA